MASSNDLKRVGVVFTADGAEDFQKTLKNISTEATKNTNEFKKLKSQYDENTAATQKLSDKLEYAQKQTKMYSDMVVTATGKLSDLQKAEKDNNEQLGNALDSFNKNKAKLQELTTAEGDHTDEIKKAQKAVDDDEKSVSKLTDTHNNLEIQIKQTSNKIDSCKQSEQNFQSQVEDCTKKLSDGTAEMQDYADKLDGIGSKLTSVGNGLTKNISTPLAAIGTASIAAWKSVDSALDTVATKTGATGDALQNMQNIVTDMATTMPYSYENIGNAVGEVNTKFQVTGTELEDLSEKFLQFSTVNNTDVTSSVDNVQQLIKAFGLTTEDTTSILDQLNQTGQQTGTDMDTLATSVADNATSLQAMGLSAEGAIQFVGELNNSGAESSSVLFGLKKALTNASTEGTPMVEALQNIQDELTNTSSTEDAVTIATELFGSKSAQSIVNACQNGSLSFTDLANSATDAAGSLQTTFDQINDPADHMQENLNQLESAGYSIANDLLPVLKDILDTLTPIIKSFGDAWYGLPSNVKSFIVQALLITTISGPIISTIGKVVGKDGLGGLITTLSKSGISLTTLMSTAKTVCSTIGTYASSLFTLIEANPVVAIISAIVVALVLLYNNCKPFRDFCNNFFSEVSKFFNNIIQPIKDVFNKVCDFFGIDPKSAIYDMFCNIGDAIENVVDWVEKAIVKVKDFFGLGQSSSYWDNWAKNNTPSSSNYNSGDSTGYAHGGIVKFFANGGVLNQPTAIGNYQGSTMVAGEAGAEAILPLSGFYSKLEQMLSNNGYGGTVMNVYVDHISDLEDLIKIQKEAQQKARMGVTG